jgi:hypothetical protein
MSIDYLKEMLDLNPSKVESDIPTPHSDSLDNKLSIVKYSEAKQILEHPEVYPVLKEMKAFDLLNEHDVDTYHTLAIWVSEALEVFATENFGTAQAIDFNEKFILRSVTEGLNDFSSEFLTEFTKKRFMDTDDGEVEKSLDVPSQSTSWLDKLAAKFGISEFGIKDFLYLYLLNRMGQGKEDTKFMKPPVTEAMALFLNEKAPPGMEGWINSVKAKFQKEYGDDWEEVLYSTAWKKYKANKKKVNEGFMDKEIPHEEMMRSMEQAGWEENGGTALWSHPDHPDFWVDGNTGYIYVYPTRPLSGPFTAEDDFLETFDNMGDFLNWVNSGEADERAAKYKRMATDAGWRGYVEEDDMSKVNEDVDDMYGGATKQEHFPRPEDKKAPKASSKVKSDVSQRIKELDKLIRDYKEKTHFFGEVKPAIFNAKEALEEIQGKINDGSMDAYKEAQIHFQKLMSPITNLFPPSLVKFLAYGNDGEENKPKDV